MSDYNWCLGPKCHTQHTQSRIRGSGRDKVLRTIKIKQGRYNGYQDGIWDYFCNQSCLFDYIKTHLQSIIAIAPRREALETPIKVEKEKFKDYRMKWNENENNYVQTPYTSTRTTIKSVDNDNG
tara:strand:+ start:119 stop:490 length:372 start_codon:yes stop_codon:yes gene_type:complete